MEENKVFVDALFSVYLSSETREGGGKINFGFYRRNFRGKGWETKKKYIRMWC
jgi:hypothetical protein